jgi:hypothetical protein
MLTDLLFWAQRNQPKLLAATFTFLGVHQGVHDWLEWCECEEFDCQPEVLAA